MRVYRLSSRQPEEQLAPREILARLAAVYDDIESDINDFDSVGLNVANRYEQFLRDFADASDDPTPVEVMKRRWRDAVNIHVWLERSYDRRFNALVPNDRSFEIVFSANVSTKARRDTTHHLASILGYNAGIVDEPDYVDPEAGNPVASNARRPWWRFWSSTKQEL